MSVTVIHKAVSKSATIQASPELQFRIFFNEDDIQIVRIRIEAGVPTQRNYIVIPYDTAVELSRLFMENQRPARR